jgi:hypothetical protein
MPTTTLATWWTPQGFVFQDPPPAFLATCEPGSDWGKWLKDAGYESIASCGEEKECPQLEVRVYRHRKEAHLFVDVWNWNGGLGDFFVTEQFKTVFFATWYVEFVRGIAQIEQAEQIMAIAKSLVAFVRHGHGRSTIDEFGLESYDEAERREEDWRRRQLLKQQEKNKKPKETN